MPSSIQIYKPPITNKNNTLSITVDQTAGSYGHKGSGCINSFLNELHKKVDM